MWYHFGGWGRAMFDRLKRKVRQWFPGSAWGPAPWLPLLNADGVSVNENTAPKLAPVYRALTLISSDVARARRSVRLSSGEFTTDNRTLDLLREPFRFYSSHDWFRQLVWIYLQTGNAAAVIVRDGLGDPIELVPLIGSAISLQVTDDQLRYRVSGHSEPFEATDILHFKCAGGTGNGSNWLWGVSPFGVCSEALTVLAQQQVAAQSMSTNLGSPRLILKHPSSLSAMAVQNLRDSWTRSHGGAQNAGAPVILQEGMEASTVEPKVGSEFDEARTYSLADVSRMTGVPRSMLGDGADSRYTGLSEQVSAYVAQSLQVHAGVFAAEISAKLLAPNESLVFDFSMVKAGSPADVTNTMVAAVNAGLVTKNEARERMGYGPLDEPDAEKLENVYESGNQNPIEYDDSADE